MAAFDGSDSIWFEAVTVISSGNLKWLRWQVT